MEAADNKLIRNEIFCKKISLKLSKTSMWKKTLENRNLGSPTFQFSTPKHHRVITGLLTTHKKLQEKVNYLT